MIGSGNYFGFGSYRDIDTENVFNMEPIFTYRTQQSSSINRHVTLLPAAEY